MCRTVTNESVTKIAQPKSSRITIHFYPLMPHIDLMSASVLPKAREVERQLLVVADRQQVNGLIDDGV